MDSGYPLSNHFYRNISTHLYPPRRVDFAARIHQLIEIFLPIYIILVGWIKRSLSTSPLTDFVKKATGIDLSEKAPLTPEEVNKLKDFQAGIRVGKMSPSAEACGYNQKTMKEIANRTSLAIFVLLIVMIVVTLLPYYDEGSKDVILIILGVLTTIAAQIYSCRFGSSVGSGEARDVMVEKFKHQLLIRRRALDS